MSETIAAVATPRGSGGIAMIRISGGGAFDVAARMFSAKRKIYRDFTKIPSNMTVYGSVIRGGKVIDDGIAVKYAAPHSYTGEDTVEISCHGGIYITDSVLNAAIEAGARIALPGEFTKRAFLSGKMTLTEAEAIGRLIKSRSEYSARLAVMQSHGSLGDKISAVAEKIKTMLSAVYVYIDYPDEDLADTSGASLGKSIADITGELGAMKDSFAMGKILTEGINCVIIGKPNTGKSTLINLLSGEQVAIVHDTPGTTRDIVTTDVTVGNMTLKIHDTAGIRDASDEIEIIGVERAKLKAQTADLVIALFDLSKPPDCDDEAVCDIINTAQSNGTRVLVIFNKADIKRAEESLRDSIAESAGVCLTHILETSLIATDELTLKKAVSDKIEALFEVSEADIDRGEILTEERQFHEVSAALTALETAQSALAQGFTPDIAGLDIETALVFLERCDAKSISDDIVDKIFHNFCVGK
ncbi:tRNA modification GTPase MnmE [Clostridia bacterium]|nr:tRNA modification GTPase MnmE [Clostridia bacterium]